MVALKSPDVPPFQTLASVTNILSLSKKKKWAVLTACSSAVPGTRSPSSARPVAFASVMFTVRYMVEPSSGVVPLLPPFEGSSLEQAAKAIAAAVVRNKLLNFICNCLLCLVFNLLLMNLGV